MTKSSPFQTILKLSSSPDGRDGAMRQASPRALVLFLHRNPEDRFTLILQDKEGSPVSPHTIPVDPRQEEILSLLRSVRGRGDSWIREEALFMDEHPVLTERLLCSGLPLMVEGFEKPFVFTGERVHPRYRVSLMGNENSGSWIGRLEMEDGIVPLSPDYLLCKSGIRPCSSLGGHYNHLMDLEGEIAGEELESCLTLFSSLYPGIDIEVEGFRGDKGLETAAEAEEGLLFEALPEEDGLTIARMWSYDPFPPHFINARRPGRLVILDREEKRLRRVSLNYGNHGDGESGGIGSWETLKKSLKRDCREMGLEAGWVPDDSGGEERLFLSPDLALPFLDRRIGELAGEFRLFGTENVTKLKLRPMQPRLGLNLKDGIDYFEGSALLSFPGASGASGAVSTGEETDETMELQQALSLFEKHNYIPLSDGSRALVNPRYFRSLRRLLETRGGTKGTVRVSLFDLPLLEELIDARLEGAGRKRLREVFEGFSTIEERELPDDLPLEGTLRPYQETGLKWMGYLQEKGLGGCLADDMGLGKTIQTIALLSLYHRKHDDAPPSLIVMPRSLLYNWKREIERFAPQLSSRSWYGSGRRAADLKGADVILTTYALVRNDIETLREREFSYLVLDEAQAIKNHNSRISKAVVLLQGRHRLALSGTPVENNLAELYALFRFLNPAMFGSFSRFSREFLAPLRRGDGEFSMRLLGAKTAPFLLRRLKKDVAAELPDRSEQLLFVDMESDQAGLYEERRQFYEKVIREKLKVDGVQKSQFFILQGLLELRQLAAVPEARTGGEVLSGKWEALLAHMEEVITEGHRCLVFTNFLDSVEIVSRELEERNIPCLTMTGASRRRELLVDDFQKDEHYKVFIMTMKTGGVGLNLTGADYVYILDPWWNRSAEQQAIDRTHRIGQTKSVFCYRIISRGTIEEKILDLQEKKQALFADILGGGLSDGASLSRLEPEDIEMLLEGEI